MAMEEGGGRDYQQRAKSRLEAKFAAAPAQFDQAQLVAYDPAAPVFGAPGSADVVVTFRNVHNWRSNGQAERSEEHTSELQSLMRISYAVFCLKKKKKQQQQQHKLQIHNTPKETQTT